MNVLGYPGQRKLVNWKRDGGDNSPGEEQHAVAQVAVILWGLTGCAGYGQPVAGSSVLTAVKIRTPDCGSIYITVCRNRFVKGRNVLTQMVW